MGKILANNKPDKVLISKIYKNPYHSTSKQKNKTCPN